MSEPIYVRASSIGQLFDCAARWQAVHLEGRRVPSNLKAQLGRAVHAGTAVFDLERVKGSLPSVDAATDAAAETMDHPDEELAIGPSDKPAQAKDIAVSLVDKYCTEFAVEMTYAGVEVGVDRLELTDLGIVLGGTADRVTLSEHGTGISDLKTGKTIVTTDGKVKTHAHAMQLGVYTLLAEAALGQIFDGPASIIGLQTNVTRDKQRIAYGEVPGVKDVLIGDDYHRGLLPIAADVAHGRITWGNPQSMLCSEKFCPAFRSCFFRR